MSNRLINETSPYLQQHAHNPVNWFPYGNEAFTEARESNRPLLISIGYSACHWCHVMENESFSKPEIAEVMNRLFVCVKVDREERPDVDQVYMTATMLLHGNGGWPLNCFALPDGRPFWGGTYFRPGQWVDLLQQIYDLYSNNHPEIIQQAERLQQGIEANSIVDEPVYENGLSQEVISQLFDQISMRFDTVTGGTLGAPKFPMPTVWQFLLKYHALSGNNEALAQLETTLRLMARGGIFDQIGGGFARYSTDSIWKVPHFEKMLYDNAQLSALYADMYLLKNDLCYKDTLMYTLNFIEDELTSAKGAFFASLDADSDGEEGLFYLWRKEEILKLFPEYGPLLCDYWGIDNEGLWENKNNILLRPMSDAEFATRQHLSETELRGLVHMAAKVMLAARNHRVKPALDDKIIVSWNALMITGLTRAAVATENPLYRQMALDAADFILKNNIKHDGIIMRSYKNGEARIPGIINDYAFTAEAFVELYQLTFDEQWLHRANQLITLVFDKFSDPASPLFWYTIEQTDSPDLIRMKEITDGVEPSGNAVLADVLLRLAHYFTNDAYQKHAEKMVEVMLHRTVAQPLNHSRWASVAASLAFEQKTIVITGPVAFDFAKTIGKNYTPDTIIAATIDESTLPIFANRFQSGKTLIYRCHGKICDSPVDTLEKLNF